MIMVKLNKIQNTPLHTDLIMDFLHESEFDRESYKSFNKWDSLSLNFLNQYAQHIILQEQNNLLALKHQFTSNTRKASIAGYVDHLNESMTGPFSRNYIETLKKLLKHGLTPSSKQVNKSRSEKNHLRLLDLYRPIFGASLDTSFDLQFKQKPSLLERISINITGIWLKWIKPGKVFREIDF